MKVIVYLRVQRWERSPAEDKKYLHSFPQIPLKWYEGIFFKGEEACKP